MKTLILSIVLGMSFNANASYSLSMKEIGIATANSKEYFTTIKSIAYAGKRTLIFKGEKKDCIVKNVTFEKYDGVKMIDEKTYNKLEKCFE